MNMRKINVVNKTQDISPEDFKIIVSACRKQLAEHAAPLLERVPWEIVENENDGIPIVLIRNSDEAGALGYHTQDPDGKVWGRVFTEPVLLHGGSIMTGPNSISTVLSHEILEAFYNPYVNLWSNRGDSSFVALELCDPVQGDSYEIEIEGKKVSVSNFVLEAWFDREMKPAGRFDYMQKLSSPLQMSRGGYTVIYNSRSGEIKSVFASQEGEELHAKIKPSHVASRSSRNMSDCTLTT